MGGNGRTDGSGPLTSGGGLLGGGPLGGDPLGDGPIRGGPLGGGPFGGGPLGGGPMGIILAPNCPTKDDEKNNADPEDTFELISSYFMVTIQFRL